MGRVLPLPYPALDYPSITINLLIRRFTVNFCFGEFLCVFVRFLCFGRFVDVFACFYMLFCSWGRSWALLERSWALLERSWGALGTLLGALGSSWDARGALLELS